MKFANIILTGFVIIFMAAGLSATDRSQTPIRLAIIGDRTGSPDIGVYGQIIEEINRLCPDLALTVGDMIVGYTEDKTLLHARWDEYDSIVAALKAPLYYTPGNNDIYNDVMEVIYRRRIGEPYFSFNYEYIHFIILDNSRWGSSDELPPEQIAWLEEDLRANQGAGQTLILMHKPFWYNTTAKGLPDTLHTLFVAYGADAVFSGHFHTYFTGRYDDVVYTNLGSSGGGMNPGPTGLGYHFCWVTIDQESIIITPIKKDAVLPWDEVTADELLIVTNMRRFGIDMGRTLVENDLTATNRNFSVTVNNLSPDQPIDDSLWWEVPNGWVVHPEHMMISVPPDDSRAVTFTASCTGELYPTPIANFDFHYAQNKQAVIQTSLLIGRQAQCFPAKNPPVIDGQLNEEFWQNPETVFFTADGNPAEVEPTEFYFAYDQENLYLASHCSETVMDSLLSTVVDHDGSVYNDDCVGYFIQPDTSQAIGYQIYFNPSEIVFDQKLTIDQYGFAGGDRSWDGEYRVKTYQGDSYWSIEAVLPLAQFGIAANTDDIWGINFKRKQQRLNISANWQVPIDYDPKTFGLMILR
ncbi:MAG: hypothetical protein GY841_11330 [FCB group bacterium]|nr:hypothetical protein [FCB group bacterium]